jgi:hypothetical protein
MTVWGLILQYDSGLSTDFLAKNIAESVYYWQANTKW